MQSKLIADVRDFSKGIDLNSTWSEHKAPLLIASEARFTPSTTGAVLSTTSGGRRAVTTRQGTRRMHQTAIGSGNPVRGLIQWDAPTGKQIVAISNGNLYYRNAATGEYGAFTQVVPANLFSTTGPTFMAPFRAATAGAPLVLFLCSANGRTYKWDGAALTQIDGTASCPNSDLLVAYHTRMFMRDIDLVKHLFWSKVGDAEVFGTGAATDGGSALTDTLTGDAITALLVIGSSLCFSTKDTMMKFTGYSNNDIQIAQDTEGISAMLGSAGPLAFRLCEDVGVVVNSRGIYEVTEAGMTDIGHKVYDSMMLSIDRSALNQIIVQYHRGQKEVWIAVPISSGSLGCKLVYVYYPELNAWLGGWNYPFGLYELARYTDPSGIELLIGGCSDGFIRHMDYSSGNIIKDDVLYDGTGGTVVNMSLSFAPIELGVNLDEIGTLDRGFIDIFVTGDIKITVSYGKDDLSGSLTAVSVFQSGTGRQLYRIGGGGNVASGSALAGNNFQGHRVLLTISTSSSTGGQMSLCGLQLFATQTHRYEAPLAQ